MAEIEGIILKAVVVIVHAVLFVLILPKSLGFLAVSWESVQFNNKMNKIISTGHDEEVSISLFILVIGLSVTFVFVLKLFLIFASLTLGLYTHILPRGKGRRNGSEYAWSTFGSGRQPSRWVSDREIVCNVTAKIWGRKLVIFCGVELTFFPLNLCCSATDRLLYIVFSRFVVILLMDLLCK